VGLTRGKRVGTGAKNFSCELSILQNGIKKKTRRKKDARCWIMTYFASQSPGKIPSDKFAGPRQKRGSGKHAGPGSLKQVSPKRFNNKKKGGKKEGRGRGKNEMCGLKQVP